MRYLTVVCLSVLGCASWDRPEQQLALPTPRMSRDSVVLEIESAEFDESQEQAFLGIWQALDEQFLPLETRRVLAANGIRCGVVGGQLPPALRTALESKQPLMEQLEAGDLPDDGDELNSYRRLSCRAGRDYEVIATRLSPRRVVMLRDGNHLSGETFEQAVGVFNLVTEPRGDGRVDIQIAPVVHHGATRQKWIAAQEGLVYHPGRSEQRVELLKFQTTLAAGATLVLGSTDERRGLGEWYFGDSKKRRVLLIRLAQTQYDDLFGEEVGLQPLTTPLD